MPTTVIGTLRQRVRGGVAAASAAGPRSYADRHDVVHFAG